MRVVLRNLPDEDPEARMRFLREQVGAGVRIEPILIMPSTPLSSTATPFFEILRRTVRDHYGEVEVGPLVMADIATDSRFLRSRGVDAYGFWPYPVDFFQTEGIHGVNERLRLDWFLQGIDLTRDLVGEWVRPK